jgi:hypothetical protein
MALQTTPLQHLNTLVLMYAGQLAAEGRLQELLLLGFTREHIARLRGVTLTDMVGMAGSLKGTIIDARIDPAAMDALFAISERVSREREAELALVKAGASQKLMRELFGLSVHQYVMDREYLGIKGQDAGRRGTVDDATAAEVWRQWRTLGDALDEVGRYLAVHASTRLPVRDIEAVLSRHWAADGQTQAMARREALEFFAA